MAVVSFVSIHASAHNGEIVGIIKMTSPALKKFFETSSISGNCLEGEGGGTVIFKRYQIFLGGVYQWGVMVII